MMIAMPFDRITLREGEHTRELPLRELQSMGLHVRVKLLLENKISFFKDGERVKESVALQALKELAKRV